MRTLTSDRPSLGWLLIAAGQALWAFGAFYYAIALWSADPMPFPSAADAGWILFYVPTVAGIVLLLRKRITSGGETVSLLDSAIGALAISAAGAALAFGAIVDATGGSHARNRHQPRVPARRPGGRRDHGRRPGNGRLAVRHAAGQC